LFPTGDSLPLASDHPAPEHTPPRKHRPHPNLNKVEHDSPGSNYHFIGVAETVGHIAPQKCERGKGSAHGAGADGAHRHQDVVRLRGESEELTIGDLLNLNRFILWGLDDGNVRLLILPNLTFHPNYIYRKSYLISLFNIFFLISFISQINLN
jgi:hypothetical protein